MLTVPQNWTVPPPHVTPDLAFTYCQLDADYGLNCKSTNETAWFYNRTSGACEQFVFGGCLGNQNRFLSQSICHSVCVLRSVGPTFMPPASTPPFPTQQVSVRSTQNFEGRTPPTTSNGEPVTPPVIPITSRSLTSPSPTERIICDEVDCEGKDCSIGGFATDAVGCRLCICADPCEVCVALLRCSVLTQCVKKQQQALVQIFN